ncbi:PREDICTED: probable calcium-binding protein CML36 [Tarenaya hassleriana]|uniref:probable calcium-binding protein CML36 n=1 Tax=Tarenaya hassleriana TaxID=28532 RepID=UPI00053C45FC|nr:PREDICTED: probable calcium-binding protein CML36 [Tarenaya hassleriana]
MKFAKFNPKRLFRSKDRSVVSRSQTSSFGSVSSSSSVDRKHAVADAGTVTPTSVLPEVSGDFAAVDASYPYSYLELVQAFKLIDKDNDGAVSRQDLEALLSRLGPDPLSQEEIDVMLGDLDRDGDGAIRLEALASRVVSAGDLSRHSAELRETFEFFDADRDGLISAEELLRVFASIGDEQCTLEDCRRMIAAVDEDGDGFVCFGEFSRMMELQR